MTAHLPHSALASVSATRETLERHGLYTKYRLGQNFLVSDDIIGKILDLSQAGPNDLVLEVGPGIGTLTLALLPLAKGVCSVEQDTDLPAVLEDTLHEYADKFALISKDALLLESQEVVAAFREQTTLANEGPDDRLLPNKLISNLPYQVAATIILKYFQEFSFLEEMTVMVQSEVADRIAAVPNNKTYGAYTAKLALYAQVAGRFQVAPGNFFPPPRVESAVIRLVRNGEEEMSQEQKLQVCQVIDAAFAQRRKTIRNSMGAQGFEKDALDAAFEKTGIAPTVRAETLSTRDFTELTRALGLIG